jgi:beta-barrel assembly-enhancing protease
VKLFEKLQKGEKKKKSFLAKAFATHPMNEDRIKRAQKEIAEYLPDRDQYAVDTSEFQEVRTRLAELMNRRQIDLGKVTPVLHRRGPDTETNGTHDGRPTLEKK